MDVPVIIPPREKNGSVSKMETSIGVVLHGRSYGNAFLLAFFPGLIAIYGLGHIYLGMTRRGLAFLVSAAIPFGIVGLTLVLPQIPWILSTIAWFMIWIIQWADVSRISRRSA